MKKILFTIALGGLFTTSHLKAQVVLEALEGGIPFTPSAKCLERVYDKHYGDGVHNYIYCAVQGPNGKKWLNLNLGAEYAKESSPHFNLEAVPTDYNDWKAFGSLFQEGRDADGHELGEYIADTAQNIWQYKYKNGIRQTPIPAGEVSNQTTQMRQWKANVTEYWAGWQGLGDTNPCPNNYQVMTVDDVKSLIQPGKSYGSTNGERTTAYLLHYNSYPNLYLMISPNISGQITQDVQKTITQIRYFGSGSSKLWIQRATNIPAGLGYKNGQWEETWDYNGDNIGNPSNLDNYYYTVMDGFYDTEEYDWGLVQESANAVAIRCVQK